MRSIHYCFSSRFVFKFRISGTYQGVHIVKGRVARSRVKIVLAAIPWKKFPSPVDTCPFWDASATRQETQPTPEIEIQTGALNYVSLLSSHIYITDFNSLWFIWNCFKSHFPWNILTLYHCVLSILRQKHIFIFEEFTQHSLILMRFHKYS